MSKAAKPNQMWPGMSRKRFKKLGRWTRATADRLGLRDWMIVMEHVPLPVGEAHGAECFCRPGQKHATIKLRWDFPNWSPAEQRQTLIHELLHIHLYPVQHAVTQGSAAWRLLGDSAGDMLNNQIHWEVEHIVDRLACEIAPHYPLP